MKNIVTREARDVIQKYAPLGDYANVAVGLRPSGVIHLGNIATMGLAGHVASEIGPQLSELNVTICDTDMPDRREWNASKNGYMKYFGSLPDKYGCHDSILGHAREGIDNFVNGLEKELGIRANVELLSNIQRQDGFRSGLKKVLDSGVLQSLNPNLVNNSLVYPICSECNTSNPWFGKYHDGILETKCSNPDCDRGEYSANILDTDIDFAVHYIVDPLRDRLTLPSSSIHIFGGDYLLDSENGKTKIDRILDVMRAAGEGSAPDIVVGPTFYGFDGHKMSKGKENGLTTDRLFEYFGRDEVVSRVMDLVRWIDLHGMKVIDLSIAKDRLFGRKK